ncbi:MAG: choice-of-anchor B domain-containing protein [Planctomycetota bacterium]|jgi:choice-of-anchor B domain-containing protein
MSRLSARPLLLFLALCAFPVTSVAHDDDPKILDRQAPYAGAGYRPGTLVQGAISAGFSNQEASTLGTSALLGSLGDDHLAFDSDGIELLSWMPLHELGSDAVSGNDCWGYVSGSGREYAIIGLSNGTSFVEISVPSDPVLIEHISGPTSLWRDVKVYQNYAYIVSEGGGGIQVINLSSIDNGVVTHVNSVTIGGTSRTHNVAIDEDSGYLYRCGGENGQGLRVYSLSNPQTPSFVGSWNSRYVHDVEVVTYSEGPYAGRQVAFSCSGFGNGSTQTGLTILDVTDKSNMFVLAQFHYSNAAYSHQAWLSADKQHLYLNDELDEDGSIPTTTHVIDVSDLSSPFAVGSFTNGNQAIGHNLYTRNDQIFEANYRSGLRIFDTLPGGSATEVAFFDTFPSNDGANFNGLWSCYPFFPSGTVIGSDVERGLFMWWVGPPKLTFDLVGEARTLINPNGDSFQVEIHEEAAGDLLVGSERLYFDIGNGLVEVPLISQGAGLYEAQTGQLACPSEMKWFVGARSSDGILWTFPKEAPYNNFDSLVAVAEALAFADDMETDGGWVVGIPEDTAHNGIWTRGVPLPALGVPDEDHTVLGDTCWLTGATTDVDGGFTTLTSPVFDIEGWSDPQMDFWLWFQRNGITSVTDAVRVEINTGNGTWNLIERIEGSGDLIRGSWWHKLYHLNQWIVPTANVQVRFRVRDSDFDTSVEAGLDDFKIREGLCACTTSSYCQAQTNSTGNAAVIGSTGSLEVGQNNFGLSVTGAVPRNFGLFFYGAQQSATPLAEGTLCVAAGASGIHRLNPPVLVDGSGFAARSVDFNTLPSRSAEGGLTSGSIWNFQFWYRDPAGGPGGFNLSDGLEVVFCP